MSPARSKASRPEAKSSRKKNDMSKHELTDRSILRALVGSAVEQPTPAVESLSFKEMSLDEEKLTRSLMSLSPKTTAGLRKNLKAFAADFCERFSLRVSQTRDLEFTLGREKIKMPRYLAAQALGALGENLLFSRRKARQTGQESARELAYLAYGPLQDQSLAHPVSLVRAVLDDKDSVYVDPILLDEHGQLIERRWSIFDLLKTDRFFERDISGEAELARFQQHLRDYPLDGNTALKLRDFFEKRATIGLRDTTRWALGSRHPWFGWNKARGILSECFENWGTENFLYPRVNIFTYDLGMDDDELDAQLANNQRAIGVFAGRLRSKLSSRVGEKLDDQLLEHLAAAAFDCYMDLPDFDLEAKGKQGGQTTVKFVSHAVMVLAASTAGRPSSPMRNTNLAAHFKEKGYENLWLSGLSPDERSSFYVSINSLLSEYAQANGFVADNGDLVEYVHIPMVMYTFYQAPIARTKKDEEILDSFSLDAMSEPQHIKNLRENPEVFEKLVVFFTLILRHFLDTDHVPDLVPKRVVWDYMMLGLWGTSSPNIVVHMYKNKKTGKVRSEVKFIGLHQVKAYLPQEDRKHEAAMARLLASQMFGPVLEPSIMRAIGTFLMALEEISAGKRARKMGPVAFARQSLEVFRETARVGVKGTLVDLATMFEVLLDNTVDAAQRGLSRLDSSDSK